MRRLTRTATVPSGDQQLISSDTSRDQPRGPAPSREPRGWEARHAEQVRMQTAVLNALEQMGAHLGGLASLARSAPTNDVLGQLQRVIPPSGVDAVNWPVAYSALTVANFGGSTLQVQASVAQQSGTAPTQGAGLFGVGSGIARTVAARGNSVTVYGTPGSTYDITAYSRPRDPQQGPCGTSPQTVLMAQGQFLANAIGSVTLTPAAGRTVVLTDIFIDSGSVAGLSTLTGLAAGTVNFSAANVDWTPKTSLLGTPGQPVVLSVGAAAIVTEYSLILLGYQQ